MPRGYRRHSLAIVGWLILAFGSPPDREQLPNKGSSAERIEHSLEEVAASQKRLADIASKPDKNEAPCDPSQADFGSDLCAQWKAANAASASAFWTWAGFLISLIGTIGVIVSLFFTWDALRLAREAAKDGDASLAIAERNAKATMRSVALAQENGERSLRAYVFVETFETEDFEIGKPGKFTITFRNIGQTPASDLIIWNQLDLYPIDADESVFVPELREGTSNSPLGQGNGVVGHFISGRNINDTMWEGFVSGKAEFVAFGKLGYTDVFGIARETTFRFRAKGGSTAVKFVVAPKGNHYT